MNDIEVVESDFDCSEIQDRMQFYVDRGILSCCSTLLMKGSEVIDYRTFGVIDLEDERPLQKDAIYRMYSNTKIVTSVALMSLYEQGAFELTDPLSKFIPSFGNAMVLKLGAQSARDIEVSSSPMRIKHLLSHSAGLSYGFIEPNSIIDQAYNSAGINALGQSSIDLEELCDLLTHQPLAYEPGTSWRYSLALSLSRSLALSLSRDGCLRVIN